MKIERTTTYSRYLYIYLSQISSIRHSGRRNPRTSGQEIPDGKLPGLSGTRQNPITGPLHPPAGSGAGAGVHVLSVIKGAQSKTSTPRKPTRRVDQTIDTGFHDNRPRILLIWSTEIAFDGALFGPQVRGGRDTRVLDNNTRVLIRVGSALSGDGVFLSTTRFSDVDVGVLDDGDGVAEDEVDGAVNVAVAVELALRVDVQGVLVAFEAAAVEDGVVGAGPESHRLLILRSGGVFERHVLSDEAVAGNR